MNKLDRKTRSQILHLLCEGQSIRAVTRLTGCSKNTVAKLLVEAGHACAAYQDKALRNLPCKRVQMDEIWSFVYAKNDNVKKAKSAPPEAGDVWTWTAICADTKLLVSCAAVIAAESSYRHPITAGATIASAKAIIFIRLIPRASAGTASCDKATM
jgi:hypothetical protein